MPVEKRILVAEDDTATHEEWRELLESWGYKVVVAEDGDKALEQIKSFDPHILLTDLKMPHRDGLQLLRDINELGLRLITLVISGAGDIPEAVEAIKLGALDYMRKPIDPPHLRQSLKTLTDYIDTREENRLLRRQLSEVGQVGLMFGKSLAMRRVIASIEQLADSSASVVITGESGTGKELAARTIHDLSPRRNAPYIGVNCAAMPDTLIESELFGHERGAFTGAWTQTTGRFQLAHNGTLFLDEVGDLPIELQPKLLRVLQEQEFERLGSSQTIRVNVRVIAATNQDLWQMVQQRRFRADLFYRLNVFPINILPLRERTEDIPILARHFVRKLSRRMNKEVVHIADEVMSLLQLHDWPGNIRELQNVLERAVILSTGPNLLLPHSEFKVLIQDKLASSPLTLADAERYHINEVLRQSGGVVGGKCGAAARLGLARTTLMHRMNKLGLRALKSPKCINNVSV